VIIIAIALGLWAGLFASAFVVGMMEEKVESVIKLEMSDFQIHQPKFRGEQDVKQYIAEPDKITRELNKKDHVIGTSKRLITNAMISSAGQSGSVTVSGIHPVDESSVTGIHELLDTGTYFEKMKRNPVLISRRLSEKYKLRLRSKLVLTAQDIEGEIAAASFRVVGIFDSKNPPFDDRNVFVRFDDLDRLLKTKGGAHEIAVLLDDHSLSDTIAASAALAYPNLEVKPWMDLATGMRMMVEMMDTYTYYIVGIIMLALLFSIVNTMLMAVLERSREIGMLMAVGMTKGRVFLMILYETIFLSMIGGPIGLLLSYLSIEYFGKVGINVGGSAYEDMGFASSVYTRLDPSTYLNITIMVLVMAIIAALYPARKALQLKPAEAIRKI
jgi:ABC-type lipoprotein release transport system permease subunit